MNVGLLVKQAMNAVPADLKARITFTKTTQSEDPSTGQMTPTTTTVVGTASGWWKANRQPIIVPAVVLPEVCYLLHTRISPRAETAFVRAVGDGEFVTEPLESADIVRAGTLLEAYESFGLGFVDAIVIATAERLDSIEVLTTDRRHFSAVRPRHSSSFRLVP